MEKRKYEIAGSSCRNPKILAVHSFVSANHRHTAVVFVIY